MGSEYVDLRSDTVTKPTREMRRAMAEAEVGDDVYREDPTINRLEELAAEMVGKDAALYVPSGTMGNQIALRLHADAGSAVLCTRGSHVHTVELGAAARNAGVGWWEVPDGVGTFGAEAVAETTHARERHLAPVQLAWIENTHMAAGGRTWSVEDVQIVSDAARAANLAVHCDGARLFNAATALDTDARDLVAPVDTVMFCLSKGLGAPVGSMLAGTSNTLDTARMYRAELGGAMRQAGIIAAAGVVALERMVDRLGDDHERAHRLALALADRWPGSIDPARAPTNILIVAAEAVPEKFLGRLHELGIIGGALDARALRLVTHADLDDDDIARTIEAFDEIAAADQ